MKRVIKTSLSIFGLMMLAFPVVTHQLKVHAQDDNLLNALQMSNEDISIDSILVDPLPVLSDKTNTAGKGGALQLKENIEVSLSDGLAFRVKNLANSEFKTRLYIRFTNEDGTLTSYALNASTSEYLALDGTKTSFTGGSGNRDIAIPANFDGAVVIRWSEFTAYEYQGTTNWSSASVANKLVKGSEGQTAYPVGNMSGFEFYVERNDAHVENNPIVLNNLYTYSLNEEGTYTVNKTTNAFEDSVSAGVAASFDVCSYQGASSFEFMINGEKTLSNDIATITGLSQDMMLDYFESKEYTLSLAEGYELKGIFVNGKALTNNTLINMEKSGHHSVNFVISNGLMSDTDINYKSVMIDPKVETGTSNFGGHIYLNYNIPTANTDGFAIRIKNISSVDTEINTFYIQGEKWAGSFMNTTTTLKDINGTTTTYTAVNTARRVMIPAYFDGIMETTWDQLVPIKYNGATSYVWTNKSDDTRYNKEATGNYAYPTADITFISMYFYPNANHANVDPIVISDFYTFSDSTYTQYKNAFKTYNNSFDATKSTVSYYNNTTSKYTFTINGEKTIDNEMATISNVAVENDVRFGYGLNFEVNAKGYYVVQGIEMDGTALTSNSIVNVSPTSQEHTINVKVISDYTPFTAKLAEADLVSTTGANGIIFDVNNTLGEEINYSFLIKDEEGTTYTASSQGAGIFIPNEGIAYYGNVFSIPNGFEGKIYIPFNVKRSVYGDPHNLPFDKDLPSTISSTISILYEKSEGVTEVSLATVLANIALNTTDIALTKPVAVALNGNDKNGTYARLNTAYNNFSGAPRFVYTISEEIPLSGNGIGFNITNVSEYDMYFRIYFNDDSNRLFVPSTAHTYFLVDENGNASEYTVNRTLTIPAKFKGTLVISLTDYATDNVTSGATCNVNRENLWMSKITFFVGVKNENAQILLGTDIQNYQNDGQVVVYENALKFENVSVRANPANTATPMVSKNEAKSVNTSLFVDEVESSLDLISLNQNQFKPTDTLIVSLKENGYSIVSATLDGTPLTKQENGTYSLFLKDGINEGNLVVRLSIKTYYSFNAKLNSNHVSLFINGEEYLNPNYSVEENLPIVVSLLVGDDFEVVKVLLDDEEITLIDNGFTIPSAVKNYTLQVVSEYKCEKGTDLVASKNQFDENSLIVDPLTAESSGNTFGGNVYAAKKLPLANTDAIGLRIKNLTDKEYTYYAIYVQLTNNYSYSLYKSEITYLSVDNTIVKTTATNRGVVIPAHFDGYMIIHYDQLIAIRLGGDYFWDNYDKLTVDQYPVEDLNHFSFYFNVNEVNKEINEMIIGDVFTLKYDEDNTYHYKLYQDALTINNHTLNNDTRGKVEVKNYIDFTTNLSTNNENVEVNLTKVSYGDRVEVKAKEGYQITSAFFAGVEMTVKEDGSYQLYINQDYGESVEIAVETISYYLVTTTYDKEIVTISMDDQRKIVGDDQKVEFTIAVVKGYQVTSVKVNGNEITANHGTYSFTVSEDCNVVILSDFILYHIQYELDGGTNHESNRTTYTVLDEFALLDPTKEGYEFTGWYMLDEENNKVDVVRIAKGTTNDITLYASFKEIVEEPQPTKKGCKGAAASSCINLLAISFILLKLKEKNKK